MTGPEQRSVKRFFPLSAVDVRPFFVAPTLGIMPKSRRSAGSLFPAGFIFLTESIRTCAFFWLKTIP